MKIYISGPITGHAREKVERAFAEAEATIRRGGYEPINPLNNGLPQSATWEQHMGRDIEILLGCDGIYMLSDWRTSKGARIEIAVAEALGIEVFFQ